MSQHVNTRERMHDDVVLAMQQRRRLLGFRRWQSMLRRNDGDELHALLHEAVGLLGNDIAVAASRLDYSPAAPPLGDTGSHCNSSGLHASVASRAPCVHCDSVLFAIVARTSSAQLAPRGA